MYDFGTVIGYHTSVIEEPNHLIFRFLISVLVLASVSGCGPSYSPDTYASNAAQQANKVEQGVVVGIRTVGVSAAGTVGTVTGAAAGGIAGSQVGVGPVSAFTALGGALVGGLGGSAVEHVTGDTIAFEYIVRKPNGDLVSVTQKDKTPLALGQKVLVIAGTQARVVPDYTVPPLVAAVKTGEVAKADGGAPGVKPIDIKSADVPPNAAVPAAASDASTAALPVSSMPTAVASDAAKPAAAQPTGAGATSADKAVIPAKPADSITP